MSNEGRRKPSSDSFRVPFDLSAWKEGILLRFLPSDFYHSTSNEMLLDKLLKIAEPSFGSQITSSSSQRSSIPD